MENGHQAVHTDEARRRWRELLEAVDIGGEHVTVLRYNKPVAVIVSQEWYDQARAALGEGR